MRDGTPGHRRSGTKTIRCDLSRRYESTAESPSATALLLDHFRRWFAAPQQEGRCAARHPARTYSIWVGWWRAEREFIALTARISNISRGGALVLVPQAPPENHGVWICLGTPEPDECLAATVLEVRTARHGECAIRLAFCEPCPSRFLEAAVCGRTSQRAACSRPGA
jgi:hypothetical protein